MSAAPQGYASTAGYAVMNGPNQPVLSPYVVGRPRGRG